jgi:hypothetical protein
MSANCGDQAIAGQEVNLAANCIHLHIRESVKMIGPLERRRAKPFAR